MREEWRRLINKGAQQAAKASAAFVGAIEKGIAKAKLSRVEIATNLDLSCVPNYIAYKAALIREKMLLQYACSGLAVFALVVFIWGRIEVSNLQERLRTKEYILAPGVNDFVPVNPQSVPDSYIQHAVADFVATLGNTNPLNIEERFKQLSSLMSPALQVQFAAEAAEWIAKAKSENVSEILTVLDRRIEVGEGGRYRAVIHTRSDSFIGSESIGYRNEVIDMGLRLVPPDVGRRWYLEITSLSRVSADAFEATSNLGGKHDK